MSAYLSNLKTSFMKFSKHFYFVFLLIILNGCNGEKKTNSEVNASDAGPHQFTLAFGSCNNQLLPNNFWDDILNDNPHVWVWGGDVIYSDTEDMQYLQKNYELQNSNRAYAAFKNQVEIHGTWDDHDYGMNDGGKHYAQKAASQQLFLDFLDVSEDSYRRKREGVYFQKDFKIGSDKIKLVVLDTRYFRSNLAKDTLTDKRYRQSDTGTMLGAAQWTWLEETLKSSDAAFNLIITSVQVLSYEHGFESWGNMPKEVSKMEALLKSTRANNVIFLSGDRHISEFSKKEIEELGYPLIDFTSSGMTHSYSSFSGEANQYRVGNVVSDKSYGLVEINTKTKKVDFKIKGDGGSVLESLSLNYGSND